MGSKLLDTGFNKFWTTTLVKIIWTISVVIAALAIAISVLSGIGMLFGDSSSAGQWAIIIGPVAAVFWLLVIRIWLELVVVLFKIADNTSRITAAPAPAWQSPPTPTA